MAGAGFGFDNGHPSIVIASEEVRKFAGDGNYQILERLKWLSPAATDLIMEYLKIFHSPPTKANLSNWEDHRPFLMEKWLRAAETADVTGAYTLEEKMEIIKSHLSSV